jgi:hypothetical protein
MTLNSLAYGTHQSTFNMHGSLASIHSLERQTAKFGSKAIAKQLQNLIVKLKKY